MVTAALWDNYNIFLYGTSFLNYPCYIYYYYTRNKKDHEIFKRDVTLYAGMARFHLWYVFLNATNWMRDAEPYTLVMIFVGYFCVMAACYALGRDRTYFGWEMGVSTGPLCVTWPYGPAKLSGFTVLPELWHPMITMHVMAYGGMYLN